VAQKSIVILISGRGTNLQSIIDAVKDGGIKARISAVISNRPDAKGLQRARDEDINAVVIDQTQYEDRSTYDRALIAKIDEYAPDLIVLAGFMRILSEEFIRHFDSMILNIHPSLLPEFKGLHTHRRALEAGKKVHGASVHFVSNELDSGPVVIQVEVPVLPGDTEDTLAERILQQEHVIYPQAISWFVEERLKLNGNTILLDGNALNEPVLWKADRLLIQQH
jgi:phosphoribosylglycinamide formyltransferase-1